VTLYAYASVHVFDTFNDFVFYGHVLSLINPETVTRLRVTKSPETGGSLIAPYKRRGFSVRNAGIRRVDNPSPPEAGNSAEDTNGVEGGRTEIKPWIHHGMDTGFRRVLSPQGSRL